MQGKNLRSHKASWKRKPSWPQLRLVAGQSEELLVVGSPWTFDLPAHGRDRTPATLHAVNVIQKRYLFDPAIRSCVVWIISDKVYQDIVFDPTENWLRVTRHGSGKSNTYYSIDSVRTVTDIEKQLAKAKHTIDLELVAVETAARKTNVYRARRNAAKSK